MILHKSITGFALLSHASCRGHAFFADMRGVREFEEKFETLGPLMFGLADGQSEAPKIMAKKVITDAIGHSTFKNFITYNLPKFKNINEILG